MQFLTMFKIIGLYNAWQWPDIETLYDKKYFSKEKFLQEELVLFCEEELEIPQEYLKTVDLYDNKMYVTLCRDKAYIGDDWYVNLSRISA